MKQNHNAGFSLVETALSLTIVALLVAAVTAGTSVKRQLELNQIVEDVESISSAVALFQTNYDGTYPGDKFDAETIFGTSETDNGNGDGDLGISEGTGTNTNETLLFWQHLSLAELISGTYDGATDGVGGRMEGNIKYSLYGVSKATSGDLMYISVGRTGDDGNGDDGLFTTKEAYDFDHKYDDGDPLGGSIQAVDGAEQTATDCVNTGSYNLTNDDENPCVLHFYIEQ